MVKEMFLIAGEISYHMADSDKTLYKMINTVTARSIGYAVMKGDDLIYITNALVGNFTEYMHKQDFADKAYIIDDVVILNIHPMGIQDSDEFMPEQKEAEDTKNVQQ